MIRSMGSMVDRIDTLGRDSQHLRTLSGAALDEGIDEQLQDIVHQASGELGTPIALVSLVLDHLQYFKAHVGLPQELADTLATDRDASFCQFAVREGAPFVVEDATTDVRVPRDLVDRHGIRAYLGVPVRARGEIVGSLCVIDMEPRGFSEAHRQRLTVLADTISHRLTEQLGARRGQALLSRATAPAFAELRNLLGPLRDFTSSAKISSFELGVLARDNESGGNRTRASLTSAHSALEDLTDCLGLLEGIAERIEEQIIAIENITLARSSSVTVSEVIQVALRLALHHTKLVGGVHAEPIPETLRLATTRAVAVASVSIALSAISTAITSETSTLRLSVIEDDFTVVITIGTSLSEDQLTAVSNEIELLGGFDPSTAVRVDKVGLHLGFSRAEHND